MRFPLLIAALPCLLGAQDAREIVCRALDLDGRDQAAIRNYSYLERQLQRQFDSAGGVKQQSLRTFEVTMQEGSPYRRLVAQNDQPLGPEEQQHEQQKLDAAIELRRHETAEQRRRRIAEWERRRGRQREALREVPDAFYFKIAGTEAIGGRPAWVIAATPKPGYHPRTMAGALLPSMKARFWIDQHDYQWVRMDAETLDNVTFGALVLRIGKGAHIEMEQTRVNDEVWLPKRIALRGSARLFLFKGIREQLEFTYSEYHKLQADSRAAPAGEVRRQGRARPAGRSIPAIILN